MGPTNVDPLPYNNIVSLEGPTRQERTESAHGAPVRVRLMLCSRASLRLKRP